MIGYAATTNDITITVRPIYLDDRSNIIGRRFVFGYYIWIENQGDEEVQLLRRHWYITDARGKIREVEGEGVVGIQPIIGPGNIHEYNSFCVLETFEGHMEGTYLMQREGGEQFRANIPRFILRALSN